MFHNNTNISFSSYSFGYQTEVRPTRNVTTGQPYTSQRFYDENLSRPYTRSA